MNEDTKLKIFASIFVIIGLIMLTIYGCLTFKEMNLSKTYEKTMGIYVDKELYEDSNTYALIYEYKVNNETYTIKTNYGTISIPEQNSPKEIYYNPKNPAQAILKGNTAPVLLLLLGIMFTVIPLIFILKKTNIIIGIAFLTIGLGLYYFIAKDINSYSLFKVFKANFLVTIMSLVFIILGIIALIEKYLPQPKVDEKNITIRFINRIEKILDFLNNNFGKNIKYIIMIVVCTIMVALFIKFSLKADTVSRIILITCTISLAYIAIYGLINLIYNIKQKIVPNIFHNLYVFTYFLPFYGLIALFIYEIIVSEAYPMLIIIIPIGIIITSAIFRKIKEK